MTSRLFGSKTPDKPHLVRGGGGLSGEIVDLRSDIDEAFEAMEGELFGIDGELSPMLFKTEEPLIIEVNQNTGVDPELSKPITKASEVPATPFKTLQAAWDALPSEISHSVTIQLKSDIRPEDGQTGSLLRMSGKTVTVYQNVDDFAVTTISIQGEREELYPAMSVLSTVDRWRLNVDATLVATELALVAFVEVVSGTGAGQVFPILDNGTDWIESTCRFGTALDATSVVRVWKPKWGIIPSQDDVTTYSKYAVSAINNDGCAVEFYDLAIQPGWDGFERTYITNMRWSRRYCIYRKILTDATAYNYLDYSGVSETGQQSHMSFYYSIVRDFIATKNTSFQVSQRANLFCYGTTFDNVGKIFIIIGGRLCLTGCRITNTPSAAAYAVHLSGNTDLLVNYGAYAKLTGGRRGNLIDCGGVVKGIYVEDAKVECIAGSSDIDLEINNATVGLHLVRSHISRIWGSYYGYSWIRTSIRGSGNTVALQVDQGGEARIDRTEFQMAGSTEILMDGVAYSYAQLDAVGAIRHLFSKTAVISHSVAADDAGRDERGKETLAAESFKAVTFTAPFYDDDVDVHLQPHVDASVWPTSITASGFTISASAPVTGDVAWVATKR